MILPNASSCSRCVRACEEVQGQPFALDHFPAAASTSRVSPGMSESFPRLRMRLLRAACVQACPDRDPDREIRHRDRPSPEHSVGDDLRLLRRRLHLQGGDARRGKSCALVPYKDGQGPNRGHSCGQGPLRLGGYTTHKGAHPRGR